MVVRNIRLKGLGSVRSKEPQLGHADCDSPFLSARVSSLSARRRVLHSRQSTSGSLNVSSWPEYFQTRRLRMMEESMPSMSSRSCTIQRHHACLTLLESST